MGIAARELASSTVNFTPLRDLRHGRWEGRVRETDEP